MERKFRGNRKGKEGRVFGDVCNHPELGCVIIEHSQSLVQDEGIYLGTPVIPETVGQSINIQDKNKVDIYSDDLLSDGKNIFRIYAVPGGFAMKAPAWMNDTSDLDLTDELILLPCAQTRSWLENSCERVGDIWQNPELVTIKGK